MGGVFFTCMIKFFWVHLSYCHWGNVSQWVAGGLRCHRWDFFGFELAVLCKSDNCKFFFLKKDNMCTSKQIPVHVPKMDLRFPGHGEGWEVQIERKAQTTPRANASH